MFEMIVKWIDTYDIDRILIILVTAITPIL